MMLSDVCRVHPVGGRRVRRAGWMARIGSSGPARPAWLKAATARFWCRPGRGHIVAATRLQLVFSASFLRLSESFLRRWRCCCESVHPYKPPAYFTSLRRNSFMIQALFVCTFDLFSLYVLVLVLILIFIDNRKNPKSHNYDIQRWQEWYGMAY